MDWHKHPLFHSLSPQEIEQIEENTQLKTYNKEEWIVREGDLGEELYFIENGQVEILKSDQSEKHYRIALLHSGELFGEMTLLEKEPRLASVRTTKPTRIAIISISKLLESAPELIHKISANLNQVLKKRLQESNEDIVIHLKRSVYQSKKLTAMSNLFISSVILLIAYQIIMGAILHLTNLSKHRSQTIVELPIILGVSAAIFQMMRKGGYPLEQYGLTTRNWKRSLAESILFTLPLMLGVVALKWVLIHVDHAYADDQLFRMGLGVKTSWFHKPSLILPTLSLWFYMISAVFQEFIIRGVFQSSLEKFLVGKKRVILAVIVSNVIFIGFHQPLSWVFPLLVVIPGFFWGWLYFRHRTLIGVSASHLILGMWAFYFVGLSP